MSENNSWAEQWFKAQQQFVDAWSDMAKTASTGGTASQSDLWAQSFELWRKACEGKTQPDMELAMRKCMDMGKEYFAMAEQISKGFTEGATPTEAINNWLEQMKRSLQQFSGMPGMNTSVFNLGEMVDPLGKVLEAPGVGYFREPQETQQKGMQLALEYQEANFKFNQAFLRIALESIQGFQNRLLGLNGDNLPKSLRELYDLWVEISEAHYAEFAMGEEYQTLYGDMVNRLMIMRRHYGEITDDSLRALNLPNTREIDTMQERLQQLRRDNFELKKELKEIRAMLTQVNSKLATPKPAVAAKPAAAAKAAPVRKKAAIKKAAAKKSKATRAKAGA